MGRKGNWFSLKKVFGSDSKKDQKHHSNGHGHRSKLACFGHHSHHEAPEGAAIVVVPSLPRRRRETKPIVEENEQNKQTFSLVLATAVAAGAAVAAAAEVGRLKSMPRYPEKMKDDVAATKIQTAFRGYLARRKLRGLRGLARLKTLIQGQSVKRQSTTTLQCMQTLSKLQSQVRARRIRMSEENQALQRQLQQKHEKEFEKLEASQEKWDDSLQSKEQIEARLLNKQVAAMRREKALAYSMTHQQTWRNPSKSANATFMDPNNPHWGWNWLERWMAARPWEGQGTLQHNEHAPAQSAARSTMSLGDITKLYSLRDQNHDLNKNNIPSGQKASRAHSHISFSKQASSKSAPAVAKANRVSSPKVGSWGSDGDSKKNILGIKAQSNRRHSIAVSPVRNDNESIASSPATASPRVAATKAKSKMQSSLSLVHKKSGGTTDQKEGGVSAKKRLSLPASPASSRRLSIASKVGIASNKKNVSANSEEKVKVRNGVSR